METQEILKVGLLTKIAGNYKKAEKQDECIDASKQAYELMLRLSNEKDAQTCRCLLNYAQCHQFFESYDTAKELYQKYITLFESQDGQNGNQNWSDNQSYTKLRDVAQAALDEMAEPEGEEEYYDEEEGDAEGEGEGDGEGDGEGEEAAE